jgi:hypothetical protein
MLKPHFGFQRIEYGLDEGALAQHDLVGQRHEVIPHVAPDAGDVNLLVSAITLWNTRYLNRAIAALRETEDVPDTFLLTYRRSAGSISISPAITSGRPPTR